MLLEALASGAPVLTTAAGGMLSVVENGVTAFVVPERDADALAAAIEHVSAHPGRARQVGAAARALVERRFGWGRAAERFEAAYGAALAFKSVGR